MEFKFSYDTTVLSEGSQAHPVAADWATPSLLSDLYTFTAPHPVYSSKLSPPHLSQKDTCVCGQQACRCPAQRAGRGSGFLHISQGFTCSPQARLSEKKAICAFWHILSSGLDSFLHGGFYLTQRNK